MANKIKSIEKGWGEGSTYFTTDKKAATFHIVDEIKEEIINIGVSAITVYRGYRNGNLYFHIEAGGGITLIFEED